MNQVLYDYFYIFNNILGNDKKMGGKTLYLWNTQYHGVPKTIEDVRNTFNALEGVADNRNDDFKSFASELKTHIQTLENKVDLEVVAAFEGLELRAAQNKEALFQVDLPNHAWLEAMRMVVDVASRFHLVVYEDQNTGMAFLPPTGQVLPESHTELWQGMLEELANPNFPQTKPQFKKYLKPKFDALMQKHGFKIAPEPLMSSPIFMRESALGVQYISPPYEDIEGGGGRFDLNVYIYICNDLVSSIYDKFSFMESKPILSLNTSNLDRTKRTTVASHKAVQAELARAEELIFAPILDVAQDLESLDRLLNGSPNECLPDRAYNKYFYAPQRLIIAKLVGNPHFEELVNEFESYPGFGGNEKARATEWPKLVQYLREEVQPII